MVNSQDSSRGFWQGEGALLVTLLVMGLALFIYPLSLRLPLFDPDEGLHASIAQEMVERGDWLTPRFLGQPFWDKPILYFWAEAASLKLLGMNEVAVRLPGVLFGLLGVLTTALLAWRMFDRQTGLIAGLTYATMILPTAMVQAASHDVALVPWVNLAILWFWESDRAVGFRAHAGYTVALGIVLGLACLTKGLVGVALIGVAYGCYLLLTRRLTGAACLRGAGALVVAALIASTWYGAMEIRNPGYLYYYFVDRHVLGCVTTSQPHGKAPMWFYLPILFSGGLPWVAYLPTLIRDGWAKRGSPQPHGRGELGLLWCWLIGGTTLLSLAQSKMITYIWPVYPAVAILAAVAWARLLADQLAPAARRSLVGTFHSLCLTGPITLPVAMVVLQHKYHLQFSLAIWTVSILVALTSWIPAVIWRADRRSRALTLGMGSVAAQFLVIMIVIMPHVASANSARELAAHFNRRGELPRRLLLVEERLGSLVFYLEPSLRRHLQPGQLQCVGGDAVAGLAAQPGTLLVVADRHLTRLPAPLALLGISGERAGQYWVYPAALLEARRHVRPPLAAPASAASAPAPSRPLPQDSPKS